MGVDAIPTPPYASCSFREILSIHLKDIGNSALGQVQTALQDLGNAVGRLEVAAGKVQAPAALSDEVVVLEQKIAALSKENGEVKECAGRVAGQLDAAIARLAAALKS